MGAAEAIPINRGIHWRWVSLPLHSSYEKAEKPDAVIASGFPSCRVRDVGYFRLSIAT